MNLTEREWREKFVAMENSLYRFLNVGLKLKLFSDGARHRARFTGMNLWNYVKDRP